MQLCDHDIARTEYSFTLDVYALYLSKVIYDWSGQRCQSKMKTH